MSELLQPFFQSTLCKSGQTLKLAEVLQAQGNRSWQFRAEAVMNLTQWWGFGGGYKSSTKSKIIVLGDLDLGVPKKIHHKNGTITILDVEARIICIGCVNENQVGVASHLYANAPIAPSISKYYRRMGQPSLLTEGK